jgi:hypothetical protein
MNHQMRGLPTVGALAGAGALWPSIVCAITDSFQTPLERALQTSWCGAGPQGYEFLGHCALCWGGSAALMAAALLVLTNRLRVRPSAI